ARFEKLGVPREHVFARLEKRGIEDIGLEDVETMIGLGTAIKGGDISIDEAFPVIAPAPAAPEQDGQRIKMGKGPRGAQGVRRAELEASPSEAFLRSGGTRAPRCAGPIPRAHE